MTLATYINEKEALVELALSCLTSGPKLVELSEHPSLEVRCLVAGNYNTPPAALTELARQNHPSINRALAWNPKTPAKVLVELMRSRPNAEVLQGIASSPNATAAILSELAYSEITAVRRKVAENYNTSVGTLATLARDVDPFVAYGVGYNPHTTAEILIELATNDDWQVREKAAAHPNCPPLVKLYLQSDEYGGMSLEEFLEASK